MGRRKAANPRDSDAAATRWLRIAGWAILLASIALAAYYLLFALWRIFGTIYRTYTEAGLIWLLR